MSESQFDIIIQTLREQESTDSMKLSELFNLPHNYVVGILNSLKAKGDVIVMEPILTTSLELTDEGEYIVENGSYEILVFDYINQNGPTLLQEILKNVPNSKIGFSKAMANGWIKKDAANLINKQVDKVNDDIKLVLKEIKNNSCGISLSQEKKAELKKRKLVKELSTTVFKVSKGLDFGNNLTKLETELTPEMIEDGSWKNLQFKNYNLNAKGVRPLHGNLHPLMKVRDEIRTIFLSMGFSEMNTGKYVENSFWNFDVLFQPQQHPARDAHDTFFITNPECSTHLPNCDLVERVERVHTFGAFGSLGYGYKWDVDESLKNILRTHTTANSARFLYKLSDNFRPVKAFSIDKVFRNETLDATHLAEFNQVEGIIADYKVSLGHLIGIIQKFFCRMGLPKVRFKPAYNPYTEPSMEIFCFHPGLQKWIEIGNSGMFRPEMLRALGLPPGVTVLGWGLSLERPAMIKYGLDNIRDLVGPRVHINTINSTPICLFSKN